MKVDFSTRDTGFIITPESLFKTTDCGDHWVKQKDLPYISDLAFKGSTGYVLTLSSILKSTNNGQSWTTLTNLPSENYSTMNMISPDTLILRAGSNLVKTFDGGKTWIKQPFYLSYNINKLVFVNSLTGHIASDYGGILKTTDGGNTWKFTHTDNSFPSDIYEIYFLNETTGFASREYTDILKTTDGGETWVPIKSLDVLYTYEFIDANVGYAAGPSGAVYKTVDGGAAWKWIGFRGTTYGQPECRSLCFIDANTGFAVGAQGEILKTTDGGTSWKGYSPFYTPISQFSMISDTTGYALTNCTFVQTKDGGNQWTLLGTPRAEQWATHFDFMNEQVGYCIGGGAFGSSAPISTLFKTVDGGKSWSITKPVEANFWDYLQDVDFLDEQNGFLSTTGLYHTSDGGNNWVQLNGGKFLKMQFINAQIGYAQVSNYQSQQTFGLMKTVDGGVNWSMSLPKNMSSFQFLNEKVGFVIGDQYWLYRTVDGGINWEKRELPMYSYVSVRFFSPFVGYVLSSEGRLFKTTDGGKTWTAELFLSRLTALEIRKDHLYCYGTVGSILKSTIEYAPLSVYLNAPSNLGADSVCLSGTLSSNKGCFHKIRFEYGIGAFTDTVWLSSDTVGNFEEYTANTTLRNLNQNTTYQYRLVGSRNDTDYVSVVQTFKTLMDYKLHALTTPVVFPTYVDVSAQLASTRGGLSEIAFEYSTDTSFDKEKKANPDWIDGYSTDTLTVRIDSLSPSTTYNIRVRFKQYGKTIRTTASKFTTPATHSFTYLAPVVNGNVVTFRSSIQTNQDTLRNLELNYGTTPEMGKKITASPDVLTVGHGGTVSASVTITDASQIFFYRFQGLLGSVEVVSDYCLYRLNGGLILAAPIVKQVSDSSVVLSSWINSNKVWARNIRMVNGATTKTTTPNSTTTDKTLAVSATMNGLIPGNTYSFKLVATYSALDYQSTTVDYTMKMMTDLKPTNGDMEVSIYPNPTANSVFVHSDRPINTIKIFDALGRSFPICINSNHVDMSSLPSGYYILQIKINNEILNRKVMKY